MSPETWLRDVCVHGLWRRKLHAAGDDDKTYFYTPTRSVPCFNRRRRIFSRESRWRYYFQRRRYRKRSSSKIFTLPGQRLKCKNKSSRRIFFFFFYISAARRPCVFLNPAFAAVFRGGTAIRRRRRLGSGTAMGGSRSGWGDRARERAAGWWEGGWIRDFPLGVLFCPCRHPWTRTYLPHDVVKHNIDPATKNALAARAHTLTHRHTNTYIYI